MPRLRVLVTLLITVSLTACSAGQGSDSDAEGNAPPATGGGSGPGTNPPGPAPGNGPPPAPTVPPVGALTCNPCKQIAFVSTRDGNHEIYRIDLDGEKLSRLTSNDAYDSQPAWSPDGTRIAFISRRDANGSAGPAQDLYVMDADGGNVRRLTFSRSAWGPTWSPDGSRIVYEGEGGLLEISAEGGTPRLLFSTPGVDMQPAWSPDGARLAVVSDWFAYDFVYDVFLINADGSGFTAVTDGNIFDQMDYVAPSWSPDGVTLAVTVHRPPSFDSYASQLGLLNTGASQLTMLLTPEGVSIGSSTWSPDGKFIAYESCAGGGCRVSWIKADGSARGEIVADGAEPDWQR